jgi:hypothetical protein
MGGALIHQRKRTFVKGFGEVSGKSGPDLGLLLRLALVRREAGWPGAGCGHAGGPRRGDLVRRGCGRPVARVFSPYVAQAGSACAPRMGGRPAPTAFNRAGEKPRGTGEGCPGWITGWSPTMMRARPPRAPGRKVLGTRGRARGGRMRWSGGLRLLAGGDAAAGCSRRVPAGVVHGHEVDPAQQRGRARDPGPGAAGAGRPLRGADLR